MLRGFFRSWTMERAKRPTRASRSVCRTLLDVLAVEFAQAVADFAEQTEREARGAFHELQHGVARDEINDGFAAAAALAERGLFSSTAISPKISPGCACERLAGRFGRPAPEICTCAILDHVNAVAAVPFLENFLAGGKYAFLRGLTQCLQLAGVEFMEERACFKRNHAGSLGQKAGVKKR